MKLLCLRGSWSRFEGDRLADGKARQIAVTLTEQEKPQDGGEVLMSARARRRLERRKQSKFRA
jgi:hypothetical protein